MKKHCLLLGLMPIAIFAQEKNIEKFNVTKPTVSLFLMVGGITDVKNFHVPVMSIGSEIMLGKKVYFYAKPQLNVLLTCSEQDSFRYRLPLSVQVTGGLGFYLFDKRIKQDGKGWSMVMNISAGIGFYFSSYGHFNLYKQDHATGSKFLDAFQSLGFLGKQLYIPFEVSLITRYSKNGKQYLQFGVHIGADFLSTNAYKHALKYNSSLGIAF